MITNVVAVDHAILFVFDPASSNIQIPDYDPRVPVGSNDACLAINVRAAVDGNVHVHIGRSLEKISSSLVVFSGKLSTPGGRIVVVTSSNEEVVSLENKCEIAKLTVGLDSAEGASEVWVEVA